jgi:thiol:disulfide interchange protein
MTTYGLGYSGVSLRVAVIVGLIGLGMAAAAHADADLLDPEDAFRVKVRQKDRHTLVVHFDTAKDYYLYKDRMRFAVQNAPGIAIQSVRFPTGEVKQDPNFGRVEVFKNKVEVELRLQRPAGNTKMTLVTDYQGCEEKRGVCYMPMQKPVTFTLR